MKKILCILFILLININLYSEDSIEYKNCKDNAGPFTETIACADKEIERQKKTLSTYINKIENTLSLSKQKEFLNSQKLWLKYKEAYCYEFAFNEMGGTFGRSLNPRLCNIDLNSNRILEFKEIFESFPQKELIKAIKNSDIKKVNDLFSKNIKIPYGDKKFDNELNTAIKYSSYDFIQFLIEEKKFYKKISNVGLNETTPLILAGKRGNKRIVSLVLKYIKSLNDLDKKDSMNLNVFDYAKSKEVLDVLKDKKKIFLKDSVFPINVLIKGTSGVTESNNNKNIKEVDSALKYGVNINTLNVSGYTPLMSHVTNSNLDIIKLLLINNADKTIKNRQGEDVFAIAKRLEKMYDELSGSFFVEDYVKKGQKLNNKVINLLNSDIKQHLNDELEQIVIQKKFILLKNMIQKDIVSPNHVFKDNFSLFFISVSNNSLEAVNALLKKGTTFINHFSPSGDTPLIECAYNTDNILLAKLLIKNGADVNKVNQKYSSSPLNYAISQKHYKIAKVLMDNGANVNIVNDKKWSPLMFASKYGNLEMVKLLIKNGAKVNDKTTKNHTALSIAKANKKIQVINFLKRNGAI